jgi:dienelactone hydrolase
MMQALFKKFLLLMLCMNAAVAMAEDPWGVDGMPAVMHEEVRFSNGDVQLAGTLYYPAQGKHLPAVVVTHGASQPTRDFGLYEHLREALPAMGIAVLVYDRRGSGESSGKPLDAGFDTLADDAIAGQHAIASNPHVDAKRTGFWGLSQGGWLAVLAANRSGTAAFAVPVSAPLVTPDVQMNFATRNMLIVRGYGEQAAQTALAARKARDAFTLGKLGRAETIKALEKADNQPWSSLTFLPSAAELTQTPDESVWRKQMRHDPLVEVKKVRVPVLFIYGGADPWVPVPESVKRLDALAAAQPNVEYRVIAGANHTMQRLAKEDMAFDPVALKAARPDTPQYFMVLADWLGRHVR